MSKGKFEPGKRVLLLGAPNPSADVEMYIRTEQTLDFIVDESRVDSPVRRRGPWWNLVGIKSVSGRRVAWPQPNMILIDPDETPEQSAEAMRDLYILPRKVTA